MSAAIAGSPAQLAASTESVEPPFERWVTTKGIVGSGIGPQGPRLRFSRRPFGGTVLQWTTDFREYLDEPLLQTRVAKGANAFGLHDMLGNVYEWCFDVYAGYPKGSVVDPEQTAAGGIRVYRGGGWRADARGCRAAIRLGSGSTSRYFDLGFRLARRSVRE